MYFSYPLFSPFIISLLKAKWFCTGFIFCTVTEMVCVLVTFFYIVQMVCVEIVCWKIGSWLTDFFLFCSSCLPYLLKEAKASVFAALNYFSNSVSRLQLLFNPIFFTILLFSSTENLLRTDCDLTFCWPCSDDFHLI